GLPGQMTRRGGHTHASLGDGPVGHPVEPPQTVGDIRSGLFDEQSLREIPTTGEFDLIALSLEGMAHELSKTRAVGERVPQKSRVGAEPAQQPSEDVGGGQSARSTPRYVQASLKRVAADRQGVYR